MGFTYASGSQNTSKLSTQISSTVTNVQLINVEPCNRSVCSLCIVLHTILLEAVCKRLNDVCVLSIRQRKRTRPFGVFIENPGSLFIAIFVVSLTSLFICFLEVDTFEVFLNQFDTFFRFESIGTFVDVV